MSIAFSILLITLDAKLSHQVNVWHILDRIFFLVLALIAVLDHEAELKSRAVLSIGVDGDIAAEIFADYLAQGQAQTYPVRIEMAVSLQSRERQPDSVLVIRCDAWAIVLHNDGDHDDRHRVLVVCVGWQRACRHVDFAILG